MAIEIHPAFRRLGLHRALGASIPYVDDNGDLKTALAWKILGFAERDGEQYVVFLRNAGDPGKRWLLSATKVQRALDLAERQHLANRPKATPRQVDYAYDLIHYRLGEIGWANTNRGQGQTMPTREQLAEMSRDEISNLISEIRYELGLDIF